MNTPFKDWIPEGQANTNRKDGEFKDFIPDQEPKMNIIEEVKPVEEIVKPIKKGKK